MKAGHDVGMFSFNLSSVEEENICAHMFRRLFVNDDWCDSFGLF